MQSNNCIVFFRFDSQHIVMENILLFISNKYIECVNSIKEFIKSGNVFYLNFYFKLTITVFCIPIINCILIVYFLIDNTVNIDCSALRQNIISFMALKFPIGGI